MKKRFLSAFLCLSLMLTLFAQPAAAAYEPDFAVSANAVYLVNLDTDHVLYEKNAGERIFPASVTKIMTAVIALENIDNIDTQSITVEPYMLAPLKQLGYSYSNGGLSVGETFTARDLLYGCIIQSASDAANTLAGFVGGGTIEGFVAMMNQKAADLGMTGTHFTNPHGLHDDNHYTTASDLAILSKYALDVPYFMEMANTVTYPFSTNQRQNQYFATTNFLLNKNNETLYNPNVRGLKTGTTDEAGTCLVSTAGKGELTYLLVLMGAPVTDAEGKPFAQKQSFVQTNAFYAWAFKNFTIKPLLEKDSFVQEVPVRLAWGTSFIRLKTAESFSQLVPQNYGKESVRQVFTVPPYVNAPITEGDLIGTVTLYMDDEIVGVVPLKASASVERSTLVYMGEILNQSTSSPWFFLGMACYVLAILTFIFAVLTLNKRKKQLAQRRRRPRY